MLRSRLLKSAAAGSRTSAPVRLVGCQAIRKHEQAASSPSFMQKAALSLATAAAVTLTSLAPGFDMTPTAMAKLTAGDPIKNASAILRYSLPIDNQPIRKIQKDLEEISDALRIPGSKSLGPVSRSVRSAQEVLSSKKADIVKAFAPDKKAAGLAALDKLAVALNEFQALVEAKDKQEVPIKQRECLSYVGQIEEAMVSGFPFQVPAQYADLPQLLGRATLEMKVSCQETPEGPQDFTFTIVLDGYSAPISAGQFADLVKRGFYNGMEIQRADGFVVQTGKPDAADGFVDPRTGKIRTVPFEVKVVTDKAPIYDETLEDLGRFNETVALPFNAYGTLAMARAEFDNNSASSQVFFLLRESELTPSGSNLLDGRYAVFGYITSGQDSLSSFKVGDKIQYIKILDGEQNLKNATPN